VISKIKLKKFQINLTLEFCLRLELINLIKFFYSLGVTFFLSNLWFQIFGIFFVVYIFFWICKIVSIFFPTRITKLKKIETKKNMLVGEGVLIQLFNTFTKLCYFYFSKGNKGKIYSYIIEIYIYLWFFFKLYN